MYDASVNKGELYLWLLTRRVGVSLSLCNTHAFCAICDETLDYTPSKAVVCQTGMTALLGEAALFIPRIPHSRQAILTALYRDTALLKPLYWGIPTAVR